MPLVNVKLAAGAFTEKQKHDMAARLTDVMVAFEGSEAFREVVWCSSRKSSATAGTSAVSRSSARISDQAWQASFNVAVAASAHAAYACVDTWLTDFRADLPKIDVPTLLIHGDADRLLPYAATAARLPGLIKDLTFVTVEGGPHNVAWTHPEVVNAALLDFLAR